MTALRNTCERGLGGVGGACEGRIARLDGPEVVTDDLHPAGPEGPEAELWSVHVRSLTVRNATITAVPENGEVIFHAGQDLLITEGREEPCTDFTTQPPPASALEPFCRVTLVGAAEPDSWSGVDAKIVIAGVHENGAPITIVGHGSIGQDDDGSLEISFEGLPRMAVVLPSSR